MPAELRTIKPASSDPCRWKLGLILAGCAWLGVVAFFTFTAQTSGDWRIGATFDYYNKLVDGFAAGQLHLPVEPDPRLVAAADPYDPEVNRHIRLPDASYFKEKYYVYFGPVPAVLVLWPYRAIFGTVLPQAVAVLVLCVTGYTAACALWLLIRRRYFPGSAWWVAPVGVLLLGLGTHVLALLRRPQLWETPLSGGYAMLMLALLAVYWALHGRHRLLALGLAGLCLGLAVGSRPPLLLTSLLLAPVLLALVRRPDRAESPLQLALAAAAPWAAVGLALAWYNHARFGSPLEFGQTYQLTSVREGEMEHFSLRYFWHNLRLYYTWGAEWTRSFPFIASRPFPPPPPGYYGGEEIYGLLWTFPVLLLAPVSLWRGWRARQDTMGVLVAALTITYGVMAVFTLCFFSATERYQIDFVPALMLLALVGLLAVEEALARRRWVFRLGAVAGAGVTIGFGVLISFDYHGRSMRATDPQAWRRIAGPIERLVGWISPDRLELEGRELVFRIPGGRQVPEVLWHAGSGPISDRIWIDAAETPGVVRFGWSRGEAAIIWGRALPAGPGQVVTLGCYVPSLARAEIMSERQFWSRAAVVLTVDGQVVLARTAVPDGSGSAPAGVTFAGEVLVRPVMVDMRRHFPAADGHGDKIKTRYLGLKVTLPLAELDEAHPLLVWGRRGAADLIGIRRVGPDEWRFFWDHWGAPPRVGPVMRSGPALALREMVVRVPVPGDSDGRVVVWLDGQEVLNATGAHYGFDPGLLSIGKNEIGATTVGADYAGWIAEAADQVAPGG